MKRHLHSFATESRGTILVFWAIALAAVLGITALSFDIGRVASTHAELQSFADHVALAAAGELDGKPDAITRATSAAAGMVSGSQSFGDGSHALGGASDYTIAFYATLPPIDTTALGTATTDPAKAQYVAITVTPRNVGLTFARAAFALLGQTAPTSLVGATAVAGFTQYACDITPMMFCLPSPTYRADQHKGDMIVLRSGGNGAAWGPGDFGFLDPTGSGITADQSGPCAGLSPTGVKYFECLLAAQGNISQCFSQRGVDTEPGQKNGIENAVFNVRFDIYQSSMNGKRTDTAYPPAPNVIKGIVPPKNQSCIGQNPAASTNTMSLPRDSCLATGTCPDGARFGDGTWDSAAYLAKNWPDGAPGGWSGGTRWSLYNAEINNPMSPSSILKSGMDETGLPSCSPNISPYPERRMIVAAGVDCSSNVIKGSTTDVPVTEFFKMFLTEPVGEDTSTPPIVNIYAEIIGSAQGYGGAGGKGGLFHDVVQLYR